MREESKYVKSAIQNSRFTLVNNKELYDLESDPGETNNVINEHPEVVAKLSAAYDKWWEDVQPLMVNEGATGPKINPFQELYFAQFGGSPSEKDLEKMSRNINGSDKESRRERRRKAKVKKSQGAS